MTLNDRMHQFRLASRELFNNYFHVKVHGEERWDAEERFSNVEEELFMALVTWPEKLPEIDYHEEQKNIQVKLQKLFSSAPWLLSRGSDTGRWDDPQATCTPSARLNFISFFDWDQVGIKDNQFVKVLVASWPEHPELVNREALIEVRYVHFEYAA